MEDFTTIVNRLNDLTNKVNSIYTNSKKIFQLPPSTDGTKYVAAYNETSLETEQFNLSDALAGMYSLTNGITALGNIVRDGADFTFEVGFEWKINGIEYANAEITRTINDAGTGNHRIDIAVVDENDDIYIVEGLEVALTSAVVQPPSPPNTLFLCSFLITESVIGDPSEPIVTQQNNIPLKINILSSDLATDNIAGFVDYFNDLNPPLEILETTSLVQYFCTDTQSVYQLTGIGKGVYGLSFLQITSANVLKFSTNGGGSQTLQQVLGEGGRGVRFTPNNSDDAVFELADRGKVVLKRGNGDFFLNAGIFEVGDELIFEAILDNWGGGVSFDLDTQIFVNGVDVQGSAVGISSNQRGYLFLSEIVSGVEYWIYRVISNVIEEITVDATPTNGSENPVSSNGVFDALELKQRSLFDFQTKEGFYLFEDFLGNGVPSTSVMWSGESSGAGSSIVTVNNYPNRTNQQGVLRFATGTTSTGLAQKRLGDNNSTSHYLGNGIYTLQFFVNIETLSTSLERFYSIFGATTNAAFGNTNGIFFIYDEGVGTYGTASANWKCITRNSTITSTITTIPVVASQWYVLKIVVNANASSVQFYIDNVLVATHTTNIVTLITPRVAHVKTVGTTSRNAYVDYSLVQQIYTTPRTI